MRVRQQHNRAAQVSKGGHDLPRTGFSSCAIGTADGGDKLRPSGVDTLGQRGKGVSDGVADAQAHIGHDFANVDGAVSQSLVGEVPHSNLGPAEQQVGGVIG